ncbi:MAG: hypothetical protein K0V04_13290 [Deltaproteobacteria bacterium]|nr:hypothetical protein [Deltaproteobacteria bacterium]
MATALVTAMGCGPLDVQRPALDDGGTETTASVEDSSSSDPGTTLGAESTGDSEASSGEESTSGEPGAVCGDGLVEQDEGCDDTNDDSTDGCLSDCSVARSCAHILSVEPKAASATYRIAPDGRMLDTWCDMETEGGGWTLMAKVNPTTAHQAGPGEPEGWTGLELNPEQVTTPELVVNGPLASHGLDRFSALAMPGTLARFELAAGADLSTRVAWYKSVPNASTVSTWFEPNDQPTQVCTDVDMMLDCGEGRILSGEEYGNITAMENMVLDSFGYPANFPVHMRLDNDPIEGFLTGVCSSTLDLDGNSWPDTYAQHWGNALLIWIRETP